VIISLTLATSASALWMPSPGAAVGPAGSRMLPATPLIRILNRCLLSQMASYDVASNSWP